MLENPGKDPLNNTTPEKMKAFAILYALPKEFFYAYDIAYATPLRDLQIFFNKFFQNLSGIGIHPVLTPVILAASFVGSLPFVAKAFLKQENNNLQKLLNSMNKELGVKKLTADQLTEKFNGFLQKKGIYHLTASVTTQSKRRLKNGFKKKPELVLKLKHHSVMENFFNKEWYTIKNKNIDELGQHLFSFTGSRVNRSESIFLKKNKDGNSLEALKIVGTNLSQKEQQQALIDAIKEEEFKYVLHLLLDTIQNNKEKLAAFTKTIFDKDFSDKQKNTFLLLTKIYGFFFNTKQELNQTINLETSLKNFIDALNGLSPAEIAGKGYDFINANNFNFWIAYFIEDMLTNQADANAWTPPGLLIVLSIMAGMSAIQAGLELGHYLANRPNKNNFVLPDHISNKTLKHQLLEEFFLEQLFEVRTEQAKKSHNQISEDQAKEAESKIQSILTNPRSRQLPPTKLEQQFNLLRDEAGIDSKTGKRLRNTATYVAAHLINFAFLGWVGGVIAGFAGATIAAAFILSNPISLALCAVGAVVGLGFAYSSYKKDKEKEESLRNQLKGKKQDIDALVKIESVNEQLRNLLIKTTVKEPIKPLTTIHPHDDRAVRRLTSTMAGMWTAVKKGFNRAFGIARFGGTGILLVRLAVIPALMMTAGTLAGPLGLAAAAILAVIWTSMNIHMYNRQSKLTAAQNTLNDLDHRTQAAAHNQDNYLTQLCYKDNPYKPGGSTGDIMAMAAQLPEQPTIPQKKDNNPFHTTHSFSTFHSSIYQPPEPHQNTDQSQPAVVTYEGVKLS